ncbi:MAG: aminotransferase class IV [Saprospiraceae bacterium]|nr:aminotransferase class IV [Saprospiraceae bacterium]
MPANKTCRMPINFNGTVIDQMPPELVQVHRAVNYGDGLFETIRVFNGQIPLFERHWQRLSKNCQILGLLFPADWNARFFLDAILKIAAANARVRLSVWRAPGGLYRPAEDRANFLIEAALLEQTCFEWHPKGITVGIANGLRLPMDSVANCKTMNALRYVLAARQAGEQGWDDALLLNSSERICEASSSNVFWWKDSVLHTIPLAEGCVAGVMRQFLLDLAASVGYVVQEKPATFAILEQSDEIFLTNAIRGIVPIRNFAKKLKGSAKTHILFQELVRQICGVR